MTFRVLRLLRPAFTHDLERQRRPAPVCSLAWMLAVASLLYAAPMQAQNPTFAIAIRDNAFDPAELTVPVGQKIELHVTNERASASEFESNELHREKIVLPGQQVTVFVGPLRAGSYEFFDDFNPQTRGHLIAR
jgi:plastocyanin